MQLEPSLVSILVDSQYASLCLLVDCTSSKCEMRNDCTYFMFSCINHTLNVSHWV